jgi:sRNA-binding protein
MTTHKERFARARAILADLKSRYQAAFASERTRPLAIGIHESIKAAMPDVDGRDLSLAMTMFCGTAAYAMASVAGAERVGLDGEPAGVVSDEEAAHAAVKLVAIREREARVAAAAKAEREKARKMREAERAKEAAERFAARRSLRAPEISTAPPPPPPPPRPMAPPTSGPRRLSLLDLKQAAAARRTSP